MTIFHKTTDESLAKASSEYLRHVQRSTIPTSEGDLDMMRAHETAVKKVVTAIQETGGLSPFGALIHWKGGDSSSGLPGLGGGDTPLPFWNDLGKTVIAMNLLQSVMDEDRDALGVSFVTFGYYGMKLAAEQDNPIGTGYQIEKGPGVAQRPHVTITTVDYFGDYQGGLSWFGRLVETGDPDRPLHVVPIDGTDERFDWAVHFDAAEAVGEGVRPGYGYLTAEHMWEIRRIHQPLLLPIQKVANYFGQMGRDEYKAQVEELSRDSGLTFDETLTLVGQAMRSMQAYAMTLALAKHMEPPGFTGGNTPGKGMRA